MKNEFLPKALNGIPGGRACISVGIGRMSTEPHYHDCVEIIYVKNGAVRVFFDNGWHELLQGSLIFVPPGCIHRCVCTDDTAQQVVIGFTDELVCSDDADRNGILRPYLSEAIRTGYILSGDECPQIAEAFEQLNDEHSTNSQSAISLTARVLLIYSIIYGVWEKRGILKASNDISLIVRNIRRYVDENFSRKISASTLASELNISYSYLSKIMMREFGTSLCDYVISRRIEHAKRLLLSTESTVTEIGYECGFPSSSAFICHFKAKTGKTPLVFRRVALG